MRSAPLPALALGAAFAALGCRQDMHDQHKIEPLEGSPFFADGRGSRPPVEGTIARGQLRDDRQLHEGTCGEGKGEDCDTFPAEVTREVLLRGQERFGIFCSPCHARTGDGDGMVVRRGYQRPPSLHRDDIRQAKSGLLFGIITRGEGGMPSYAAQIPAPDRWAIVAYVRALQLSRSAAIEDVPEPQRSALLASREAARKRGAP